MTSMTPQMTRSGNTAAALAEDFAYALHAPTPPPPAGPWRAHSLASGAAGITLLHIERAHRGHTSWTHAHTWIRAATSGEISAADNTGLFLGAPATAYVLHTAAVHPSAPRYDTALTRLDSHINTLALRRVEAALARIRRGEPATFREYDLFYGLTGIGAYLLGRDPTGPALARILGYLTELTNPLSVGGRTVPGWWVGHDPHGRPSPTFPTGPAGHANLGAAHGITGPLLLLAQAARRGITVDGQVAAIATITSWLNRWRQDGPVGPWWPEHLTWTDIRRDVPAQRGPTRPSWCYGTPGIARAGQLAAIATGDTTRQRAYEDAFARCLADANQLARITDTGLCHGWAGLYQTAWRAARDATDDRITIHLPQLADVLLRHAHPGAGSGTGFLDGDAGTALSLITAAYDTPPTSEWDACLLIN